MPGPYPDQLPDRQTFLDEIRVKSANFSPEVLNERLKFAEALWKNAQLGLVRPVALDRIMADVLG